MTTGRHAVSTLASVAIVMTSIVFSSAAKDIPAILPDPDGKPGDATKPVKVYILAGQSNMVGMGELGGAKNLFDAVYLTADPAAPKGPIQIWRVGNYKIASLTVCGPDGTPTDRPIAQGLLEVPEMGVYQVHCGEKPKTLWEKEVLLICGTFEFPPLKEGHRYRIVVGGSAHVNSGEGYAIYVNGKLLSESDRGVAVRQGGQPRGAHIYSDFRNEFKGGKVTIAATSFLRYNHPRIKPYPPRGHFTLWIQEQKLPPVKAATDGPP